MPLIRKRRVWWEPVPEATSYVVYVSRDNEMSDAAKFSWENTHRIIFKPVIGKTEIIIPDEWLEFPTIPGIYYIAITSKDYAGNQSDPLLLSAPFKFHAPPPPSTGGIQSLPLVHPESGALSCPPMRQGRTIIEQGLKEVRNNRDLLDAYFKGK